MPSPPALRPIRGLPAIWMVTLRELRSSLRDRQTVVNSVVLPIVMYPIMMWVVVQGFLVVQGHKERTEVQVTVLGDGQATAEMLAEFETFESEPGNPNASIEYKTDVADAKDEAAMRALLQPADETEEDLYPDAILRLPEPDEEVATLYIESTRSHSELAADRIETLTQRLSTELRQRSAKERGLKATDLDPIDIKSHTVTTKQDQGALMLSMILPMMIVFMAVMGAFFPAVDFTAGEKERGTAETTLLLPIPRSHVLFGKILATTLLAFLATILNLVFLGLALRHLLTTLGPSVPIDIQFPFMAVLYSIPLILLFCFFVSAVLTALAGLTKSFKEGQAMLGPAQMVFILPAIIGVIPGLKLSVGWALVPVVNVVLATRAILVEDWLPIPYAITALVLLVSAWLAVRLCVRILSQEALAFAGSSMSLKDLFKKGKSAKSSKP